MKKALSLILALVLCLSLCACNSTKESLGAATNPSTEEPPATESPATVPPATVPPATVPPATVPPATESPATEPPATEPPATEPPATEPPATVPPVTEAPKEEPLYAPYVGKWVSSDGYYVTVTQSGSVIYNGVEYYPEFFKMYGGVAIRLRDAEYTYYAGMDKNGPMYVTTKGCVFVWGLTERFGEGVMVGDHDGRKFILQA